MDVLDFPKYRTIIPIFKPHFFSCRAHDNDLCSIPNRMWFNSTSDIIYYPHSVILLPSCLIRLGFLSQRDFFKRPFHTSTFEIINTTKR